MSRLGRAVDPTVRSRRRSRRRAPPAGRLARLVRRRPPPVRIGDMTGRRGDPTADSAAERAAVQLAAARRRSVAAPARRATSIVNRFLPSAAYVPWNLAVAAALLVGSPGAAGLALDRPRAGTGRPLARSLRWGAARRRRAWRAALRRSRSRCRRPGRSSTTPGRATTASSTCSTTPVSRSRSAPSLLEELAFRGVLPAVARPARRGAWRWRPVLGGSVLFGLWHVLPSLDLARRNEGVDDARRSAARR